VSLVHVNAGNPWQSVLRIHLPINANRIFCLIGGYSQQMMTWNTFVTSVITNPNDGYVVFGRRKEKSRNFVGLMSLADQIEEVDSALHWLIKNYLIGLPIILVGHSLGGLIAREVAARQLERIYSLVQIAPVPPERFALFRHGSFWLNGGLIAALAAPFSLVNGRGFIPPHSAIQGLFTSRIGEEHLYDYLSQLTPDSVRVFLELMLFYDGQAAWKAVKKGLRGKNTIVIAPADTLIPRKSLEEMGRGIDTKWLVAGTPHCIQFSPGTTWTHNVRILHQAMDIKVPFLARITNN
jgi:pimeloyl-ACP methyl ester carboxylesterase